MLDPGARGDDNEALNDAGFAYYATIGLSQRRSFNNIMVAVFTPEAGLRPVAFLPPRDWGHTDGNTYFRIPEGPGADNFIVRRKSGIPNEPIESGSYPDLPDYRDHYWPDGVDPYEEFGKLENPAFRSFDADTGRPRRSDDFRLHVDSPAKDSAVEMPKVLHDMYKAATGTVPTDRGCYPLTGARLRVGVDGRRVYPRPRPGPGQDTHDDDTPTVEGGAS